MLQSHTFVGDFRRILSHDAGDGGGGQGDFTAGKWSDHIDLLLRLLAIYPFAPDFAAVVQSKDVGV